MRLLSIKHKDKSYIVIVSKQDWKRVNKYKWHIHFSRGTKRKVGQPYARATIGKKKVYLQRFITGANLPLHVDHFNHQTLDCRQENLEIVTHDENMKRRRRKMQTEKKPKIVFCDEHGAGVADNDNKCKACSQKRSDIIQQPQQGEAQC